MRSLQLAWLWQLVGAGMVAVVLVASLIPLPTIVQPVSDKLLHIVAYLGLAGWFGAIYLRRWHLLLFVFLLAFGIGIEFLQRLTPYRSFETKDMIADAVGAGIGVMLAGTPLGNSLQWLEKWTIRN